MGQDQSTQAAIKGCPNDDFCKQFFVDSDRSTATTTVYTCNKIKCDAGMCKCLDPFGFEGSSSEMQPMMISTLGCYSNEDCMNLDSRLSRPDKLVYSCPNARCVGGSPGTSGTCNCVNCKLDPYSGKCCQGLEKVGNDIFCVNSSMPTFKPEGISVVTDFKPDSEYYTRPATTMPATTRPATTMPATTTLPATTWPATTMPATTMPATTQPFTNLISYLDSLVNI